MMLTVLVLPMLVVADPQDDEYSLIFRYGHHRRTPTQVENILKRLQSYETGLDFDDPRRTEVRFWLEAARKDVSKCNRLDYDMLTTRLGQDKSIAEARRTEGGVFNLEKYAKYIRQQRLVYCQKKFKQAMLGSAVLTPVLNSVTLSDLTKDYAHSDKKDANELGKRVAELLLRLYLGQTLELSNQTVSGTELIRKHYERHAFCTIVLDCLKPVRGMFEFLTISENYQCIRKEVKSLVDKVSVCLFIEETEQVFGYAAEIVYKEKRMMDLYDPVFRFSSRQLSVPDIYIALFELESYRTGLATDDPRRTEVSFWIDAARHDESKCDSQHDAILRSHFEEARARAMNDGKRGDVFNLEYYFNDVILERLLYCDSTFGVPLITELTQQFNQRNYGRLFELTKSYRHTDTVDAHKVGERIGDMILRNSIRTNFDALRGSLDDNKVAELYRRHSPCVDLLDIAAKYERYYSLIVAPENYLHVRPSIKNWVDKISVCRFIDQSKQVFEYASRYLSRKKQTRGLPKPMTPRKLTQFQRTPK